jgi:hypothetical protein
VRLLVDGRERSGFSYDPQTDHLVFDKMVRFGKGKHSVRIVATDEAGAREAPAHSMTVGGFPKRISLK